MTSSGWHRKRTDTPAARARKADYNSKAHRDERARRIAAATPSTPCGYCGKPLGPAQSLDRNGRKIGLWHLPHLPDRSGYAPGLWHAHCNRVEASPRGARTTNAQRQGKPTPPPTPPKAAAAPYRPRDDWT